MIEQTNGRTSPSREFNEYLCVRSGCPRWIDFRNTNVDNGTRNAALTVADCKTACESNPSCTGVEWVTAAAQGEQCWLSGNWSGIPKWGEATGVTYYYINTNCNQDQGNSDNLYC